MKSHSITTTPPSTTHKIVWGVYLVTRELRMNLLQNTFGFVSTCKHQPTCGENLLLEIENRGWVNGGVRGISQLLRCV